MRILTPTKNVRESKQSATGELLNDSLICEFDNYILSMHKDGIYEAHVVT